MMLNRRTNFTLIEVIVSLAILTMGLMSAFMMSSMSYKRSLKASKKWTQQHILSQAVEYYLLAGPNEDLPDSVFPYDDYSVARPTISEPEGIPSESIADIGSWRLVCLTFQLKDDFGNVVETLKIDKIMHKDDL